MRLADRVFLAGAVTIATLAPRHASASPEFPDVIRSHLSLAYVPRCTLCHATNDSDAGPVDTPFASSMRARGLVADDDDSVRAALDAMRRDRVDSDGDRMADIDELSWGLDPNVPNAPQGAVAPPVNYGCSAVDGSAGGGSTWPGVVAAAALVAIRSRRRRCRWSSGPSNKPGSAGSYSRT